MSDRTTCAVPDCAIPGRHVEYGDDPCDGRDCKGCLPGLAMEDGRGGLLVCAHHHRAALFSLARLPGIYDALCEGTVRRTAMLSEFVATSGDAGISLDENVMEAKEQILGRMANLCAFITEERGFTGPDTLDVRTLGRFLAKNAHWLSSNRMTASVWGRQLENIARYGTRYAYRSKPSGVFLGECPVETPDGVCGARLWHEPTDYSGEKVTCRRCETTNTVEWWRSMLEPNADAASLLTAQALVPVLAWETRHPITEAQIRQWAHRGFIQRHGKDTKGRTLYDRLAVLAYATSQTREEPAEEAS